jgi:hypothetical protein
MRTEWARRWVDLNHVLVDHLGGNDVVSEPERALARRAATIMTRLEQMEQTFTEADDGGTDAQHETYARLTNTLRRVFGTIGIKRRPKDVTPDLHEYLASRPKRPVVLDHEDDD